MSQLIKLTEVPKSTILYYIKEGLLPEAKKIKPNVHKYNQEHIDLLKYIKYMQNDIHCSISELKTIMQNKKHKLTNSKSMLIPLVEMYMGVNNDKTTYTKKQILEMTGIASSLLDELLDDGIIVLIKEDTYTSKEISMINLVLDYQSLDLDYSILREYASLAKQIVNTERKMQNILCDKSEETKNKALWHLTFETFFTAKQYMLNQHSYISFIEKFKKEM